MDWEDGYYYKLFKQCPLCGAEKIYIEQEVDLTC